MTFLGPSTQVNWAELLRDRIRRMGTQSNDLYDSVVSRRATDSNTLTNSAPVQATIRPIYGSSYPGVPTEVQRQNTAAPSASLIYPAGTDPARTGVGGSGSGNGGGAGGVINSSSAAPTQNSSANAQVPGAGQQPGWTYGTPVSGLPFDYTSGSMGPFDEVAVANRDELATDPDWQRRLWSNSRGGDLTTQQMLADYLDPEAAFALMGGGAMGVDEQLKYADAFNQYATGTGATGQAGAFEPSDMVSRMIQASATPVSTDPGGQVKSDPLAAMLGANGSAFDQVNNWVQFMDQTLQFTMSERTYAAYKSLIQREGQMFTDWRMSSEGMTSNVTFGQWLQQRLGPTGGL